jgi:hypothetical protein
MKWNKELEAIQKCAPASRVDAAIARLSLGHQHSRNEAQASHKVPLIWISMREGLCRLTTQSAPLVSMLRVIGAADRAEISGTGEIGETDFFVKWMTERSKTRDAVATGIRCYGIR